jgi:hypothetical protein
MNSKRLRLRGEDSERAERLMKRWGLGSHGEVARAAMRACELLSIAPFTLVDPSGYQVDPLVPKVDPKGPPLPNVSKSTTSLLLPSESCESKPSPSSTSGEPEFFSPTIASLPSNLSGVEVPITEAQATEFERLYPAVDVRQSLNEMRGWLIANPSQRKTKAGMLRFVNSWLSKAQNRGTDGRPTKKSAHENFIAGGLLALEELAQRRRDGTR